MKLLSGLLTLPVLAAALVGLPAAAAHAASNCATPGAKWTGGTIQGQDGDFINAQIGVQAVDAYGRTLSLGGCVTSGYTENVWENMDVSGQGTTVSTSHSKAWHVALPSNAVSVWIEVYTRTNTPKSCASCDGPDDTSKYGFVNRRAMPLDQSIPLTAPLHCGVSSGGVTGSSGQVVGRFTNAAGDFVSGAAKVWSQAPQSPLPQLEGWGESTEPSVGSYVVDTLAANQRYAVWGTIGSSTTKVNGVWVPACGQAAVNFGPGQLKSSVSLAPGGPTGAVAAWTAPNGSVHVARLSGGQLTGIGSLGGVAVGAPAVAFVGGTELVMVRGSNGYLYERTNAGSGWSGWLSFGARTLTAPAMVTTPGGVLWVVVVGVNRSVYGRYLEHGRWSGWLDLGGQTVYPVAATALPNGSLEVGVIGLNQELFAGTLAGRWGGWSGLGGRVYAAPAAVVLPGATTPLFVVVGGGSVLWGRTATSAWARIGGSSLGTPGLVSSGGAAQIVTWGAGNLPYSAALSGGHATGYTFAG